MDTLAKWMARQYGGEVELCAVQVPRDRWHPLCEGAIKEAKNLRGVRGNPGTGICRQRLNFETHGVIPLQKTSGNCFRNLVARLVLLYQIPVHIHT